jgi:hypothetical protein
VVSHLNETNQQIRSLTKLHELAAMMDRCRRQNKIDLVALKSIRETIKFMIQAQASYEEKQYRKLLDVYYEAHPDLLPTKNITVDKKTFLSGWRYVSENDSLKLFAQPVTEAIAPRYSEFVKRPMDLSTIKKKIEKGQYSTLEDFNKDVELMLNNCKTYNTPTSEFGMVKSSFSSFFFFFFFFESPFSFFHSCFSFF